MLELKDIKKIYSVSDRSVAALNGVSIAFRKNEFVAILGPSGCGKTTLLNIVGGLDRATEGDLVIDGISTKEYKDRDWDGYRNSRIGFVFQSYNLIPHLTVIENVEMALIVSGESRQERRRKAAEVLTRVGLADQFNKRPNQLSGGQMQRVSIARALVNNPEIILADEPTGALDSTTSVQVMDLLEEVARERLVILVTHNGELADKYATRVIKLLDGKVVGDNNPFDLCSPQKSTQDDGQEETQGIETTSLQDAVQDKDLTADKKKEKNKKSKNGKIRTKMGFLTALSLSLKNLLTKKVRTFLTAFAGSIGIIGIALVLALSSGFSAYIEKMQVDTMSSYPLTISKNGIDIDSMLAMEMGEKGTKFTSEKKIYFKNVMERMQDLQTSNNITKTYIDTVIKPIEKNPELAYGVTYNYDFPLRVFSSASTGGYHSSVSGMFAQLLSNDDYILGQYDVLTGHLPTAKNEVVLFVDQYNEIYDIYARSMGLDTAADGQSFDDILNLTFRVITNHDIYKRSPANEKAFISSLIQLSGSVFASDATYEAAVADGHYGLDLKIVGILRTNAETTTGFATAPIGYSSMLTEYLLGLEQNEQTRSPIAAQQLASPDTDVYHGVLFSSYEMTTDNTNPTYESNLKALGVDDTPTAINIYPVSFAAKDEIKLILDDYNNSHQDDKIVYTDVMQLFIKILNTVVDGITYVLVAFTAISLVVSSVMIGIITYVSVLERTKEIGILRSIGARKIDVSRVFNAETLIVGFSAGALGVGIAYLLSIPLNALLYFLVEIKGLVALSPVAALILVAISMVLTLVAGLVPSSLAAKRDPVVALRTE